MRAPEWALAALVGVLVAIIGTHIGWMHSRVKTLEKLMQEHFVEHARKPMIRMPGRGR